MDTPSFVMPGPEMVTIPKKFLLDVIAAMDGELEIPGGDGSDANALDHLGEIATKLLKVNDVFGTDK